MNRSKAAIDIIVVNAFVLLPAPVLKTFSR